MLFSFSITMIMIFSIVYLYLHFMTIRGVQQFSHSIYSFALNSPHHSFRMHSTVICEACALFTGLWQKKKPIGKFACKTAKSRCTENLPLRLIIFKLKGLQAESTSIYDCFESKTWYTQVCFCFLNLQQYRVKYISISFESRYFENLHLIKSSGNNILEVSKSIL